MVKSAEIGATLRPRCPPIWNAFNETHNWLYLKSYPNGAGLVNALGLNRDLSRCTTHIMLMVVGYFPDIPHLGARVRITRCGIFKLEDIRQVTKKVEGWASDLEIKRQIDKHLNQEPLLRSTAVPTLCMVWLDSSRPSGPVFMHALCRTSSS